MHCHVVPRLAVLRRGLYILGLSGRCTGSFSWLWVPGIHTKVDEKSYNRKLPKLLSMPMGMSFHNEGAVLKDKAFHT